MPPLTTFLHYLKLEVNSILTMRCKNDINFKNLVCPRLTLHKCKTLEYEHKITESLCCLLM